MRKIIYSIVCISFFAFTNAQTNTTKAVNTFLEKVNNKLSTIKAAEYLAKFNLESRGSKPLLLTYSGNFEIDPSDSLIGCRYMLNATGTSVLFENEPETYNGRRNDTVVYTKGIVSTLYKKGLYITDLNKYPQKIIIDKEALIFHELLKSFHLYSKPEEDINDSTTETTITSTKEKGLIYHVITYKTKFKDPENQSSIIDKSVSLQVTNDYLPIKLTYKFEVNGELSTLVYNIETYKVLENIPDSQFSPTVLGKYNNTYHYQGKEKGYAGNNKINEQK